MIIVNLHSVCHVRMLCNAANVINMCVSAKEELPPREEDVLVSDDEFLETEDEARSISEHSSSEEGSGADEDEMDAEKPFVESPTKEADVDAEMAMGNSAGVSFVGTNVLPPNGKLQVHR